MNVKERLIKEIEQMPEEQLQQVLEFVRSLESVQLPSNTTAIVGAALARSSSSQVNEEKEKLIKEIEQMLAEKVLQFARSIETASTHSQEAEESEESPIWKAYLASKQAREEVYRRLANS